MRLFKSKRDKVEKALRKILKGCDPPTFPQLVFRILQKVRDPDASMDAVVETLQWDPGLVVRILRTVNTAAYGPAIPIRDVAHAVSFMGRSQLEQLILVLTVKNAVPSVPLPCFDPQRFWLTASRRAALARQIAERLHPSSQADSFTGGLLQDMALPILAVARAEEYGAVLQSWHRERDARLAELEQTAFGWTHADVGGLLGRVWELPQPLVQAIQNHHRTDLRADQLLPALKLVALLRETGREGGGDEFIETARAEYGLDPDWSRKALQEADEHARDLSTLMS